MGVSTNSLLAKSGFADPALLGCAGYSRFRGTGYAEKPTVFADLPDHSQNKKWLPAKLKPMGSSPAKYSLQNSSQIDKN